MSATTYFACLALAGALAAVAVRNYRREKEWRRQREAEEHVAALSMLWDAGFRGSVSDHLTVDDIDLIVERLLDPDSGVDVDWTPPHGIIRPNKQKRGW
jgi:hypothetical protein